MFLSVGAGQDMQQSLRTLVVVSIAATAALAPRLARAIDEIQVYNAEIAEVGQWTIQQHLNYVIQGRNEPDFPGGLISHHSLNGTPELAYGLTKWWEIGFYAPFAVQNNGQFLSDGFKFRSLFVSPDAAKRNFFYGVNFEFSYSTPKFSPTRSGLEIRPILGWRKSDWEFIINPIVDLGFGDYGEADFVPAARLARKLAKDFFIGLEYYADFGEIGHFLPLQEQKHTLFAVTDFKVGKFDVNLGLGVGLTPGSDPIVAKAIIGYAFPVPGKNDDSSDDATKTPLKPKRRASHSLGGDLFAER
jgi:hypothetical protein